MAYRPGETPLYTQIKQRVEEQIRSGQLRPGDRIPSEAELAQQFGVSRITSKQALILLAREGLVYRIPGKGSFVADATGPNGSPRRTLGLILPVLTSRYELELLRGAEEAARLHGSTVVIRQSSGLQENEAQAIADLRDAEVSALLIWPVDGEFYNPALLQLSMEKFPTVLVDRHLPGIPLPAVTSDNRTGAHTLARHLINLGHRNIAVVSHPPRWSASIAERILGFGLGIAEAGIPVRDEFWLLNLDYNTDQNRVRIREFLSGHPEVTAVFAVNDGLGTAAYLASGDIGRAIPENLSLVCFDQFFATLTRGISITHMAQQAEEMGRQAAELALKRVGSTAANDLLVQLPTTLVEGHTCANPHTPVCSG